MDGLDQLLTDFGVSLDPDQPSIDSHSGSLVQFGRIGSESVVVKATSSSIPSTLARSRVELAQLRLAAGVALPVPRLVGFHDSADLLVVVTRRPGLRVNGCSASSPTDEWI